MSTGPYLGTVQYVTDTDTKLFTGIRSGIPDPSSNQSSPESRELGRKIPMLRIDYRTGACALERSRSRLAQVYLIKALYFKQFILDPIGDDDGIVMKIFDPEYPTDQQMDCKPGRVTGSYDMEKKCIDILHTTPNYNSIYLKHKELIVSYNRGYGCIITGKVILSRYIRKTKIPRGDLVLYHQAQEQLSLIHQAGILFDWLKPDHILVEKDTMKVFIFDFNAIRFINDAKSYEGPYHSNFSSDAFVKCKAAHREIKADEDSLKENFNI